MQKIKSLLFGEDRPVIRNAVGVGVWCLSLVLLELAFRGLYPQKEFAVAPLIFDLLWVAALGAVSLLLPRIIRRIFMIGFSVFFSVLTLVQVGYYSFFGSFMSFSSTVFAGDGAAFFDLSYFVIPKKIIAAALLVIFCSVICALILPRTRYRPVFAAVTAVCLILSCVGIVLYERGFLRDEKGEVTWSTVSDDRDMYSDFVDFTGCLRLVGLMQYTWRDSVISSGLDAAFARAANASIISAVDDYYSSREPAAPNEYTGIFEGKNLILIQLEAIDTWMLTPEVMPNLWALKESSLDFVNFYAPRYLAAATFNTESIVNTGLLAPPNAAKLNQFNQNSYPYAMARLFAEKGYAAESFHQINGTVYNRNTVHPNWGYAHYNSGAAMGLSNMYNDSYLLEGYEHYVPDKGNFFSFIITYTGHGPYNADDLSVIKYEKEIRSVVDENAADEYVRALCHARETDEFIGGLVDRLDREGRLDDTVLMLYTDHYDHYLSNDLLYPLKGGSDSRLMSRLPFMIYCRDLTPAKITKTVASYDILPTVANLFALDTDGRYYFGDDAFSDRGGYVMFSDRSWIVGETVYPADSDPERREEIVRRFNVSWNTVKLDYFALKGLKN